MSERDLPQQPKTAQAEELPSQIALARTLPGLEQSLELLRKEGFSGTLTIEKTSSTGPSASPDIQGFDIKNASDQTLLRIRMEGHNAANNSYVVQTEMFRGDNPIEKMNTTLAVTDSKGTAKEMIFVSDIYPDSGPAVNKIGKFASTDNQITTNVLAGDGSPVTFDLRSGAFSTDDGSIKATQINPSRYKVEIQ